MENQLYNVNVASKQVLPSPAEIKAELPLSAGAEATVLNSRRVLREIMDGRDPRLFVVVGPCSIHDVDAAMEYARRLKPLADEMQ
ncbi:MAG: 3-deoxy-7-phosphoheptulonate synthase, partial [Gammaproteobacteria bacterium]